MLPVFLEGTNQVIPDTSDNALYVVVEDKAGNPVISDNYIIHYGLPKVETTFPREGASTLDAQSVIDQVYKELIDENGVVTIEEETFELNNQNDFDTVLSKANTVLAQRFKEYRDSLEQRTASKEKVILEPQG